MAWNLDTKSGWNVETAAKTKQVRKKKSPARVVDDLGLRTAASVEEAMKKIEVKKEEPVVEVPVGLLLRGLKVDISRLMNIDNVSTFTAEQRVGNFILISGIGKFEPRSSGNLARKGLYLSTGAYVPMVVRDNEGQYVLVFDRPL